MKKLPEVLALELKEARAILTELGYNLKEEQTIPPGKGKGLGFKRVIAAKELGPDLVKVIWSYEKYE